MHFTRSAGRGLWRDLDHAYRWRRASTPGEHGDKLLPDLDEASRGQSWRAAARLERPSSTPTEGQWNVPTRVWSQ